MKHYLFLRKLSPSGVYGGCEKLLIDWFRNIDYKKNRITLVTTKDVFSERLKRDSLPVKVIKFPFDFTKNTWLRFTRMFGFLWTMRPNAIIFVQGAFHDFNLFDFLAGFILSKGNIYSYEAVGATILSRKTSKLHLKIFPGIGLWWYKQMFFAILRGWLCKKILAVSNEVKERMVKRYHYPKNRIITAYYGVDLKKFSPDPYTKQRLRKDLNIPKDHTIIITVARFSKEKCLHRLINAFDILYKDFRNCWLLLIGDGVLQSKLKKLANEKLSKERIKFLGFREDISGFLQMSDVFVLPSDIEGLSIAMLDALATGLISIVTQVPGSKEVIKDGINGFIVERSEQGVLKGLIKALTLKEEQRKEISNNARRFMEENFDIEKRTEKVLSILSLN